MGMRKPDIKLTKRNFLQSFVAIVLLLWIVKLVFPSVAATTATPASETLADSVDISEHTVSTNDTKHTVSTTSAKPHPIRSVNSYKLAFPDSNAVQLLAAEQWGVTPVKDRADAESRKKELVYVSASPYYHVDPLRQSIPYLVPRASILLHDIGRAFFDSLNVKGVPLHRLIVTSVLRTQEDVARLRNFNQNATENSCHLYGTTFDICYNRYQTVEDPDGRPRRQVRNDTLKYVLSEVLRDMRQQQRCYIKYEVKQGCFHMTVR